MSSWWLISVCRMQICPSLVALSSSSIAQLFSMFRISLLSFSASAPCPPRRRWRRTCPPRPSAAPSGWSSLSRPAQRCHHLTRGHHRGQLLRHLLALLDGHADVDLGLLDRGLVGLLELAEVGALERGADQVPQVSSN